MIVPILKHGSFLVASIQASLTDMDLKQLRSDLLEKIQMHRSAGVVIDVSGMDIIDSFATRMLQNLANSIHLRGAELVIVGIQPDVAYAMVQMGLCFEESTTALDLEEGFELIQSRLAGVQPLA